MSRGEPGSDMFSFYDLLYTDYDEDLFEDWVEHAKMNQTRRQQMSRTDFDECVKPRRPLQGNRTSTPFDYTTLEADGTMIRMTREHTLTGFGELHERRRFVFLEPMPASQVCSVCDLVSSVAVNLPCGHVFCKLCTKLIVRKQGCPIDSIKCDPDDVDVTHLSRDDLEQRRVLCGFSGATCRFFGTLSDVMQHMQNCDGDEYKCPNCDGSVFRGDAELHFGKCNGGYSVAGSVVPSTVLKDPRVVDDDAEALRLCVSSENMTKSTGVQVGNSVIEHVAEHEGEALPLGKGTESQDHSCALQGSSKAPITTGPYRAASKPGVSITMCVFKGVYVKASLLKDDETDLNITSDQCTLAGYTFRVRCHFLGNEKLGARIHFVFFFESGEWDDNVVWPFAKKVTLVLSHPLDAEKDIRLPLAVAESEDTARKPDPIVPNNGYKTRDMHWDCILQNGYVGKKKLYVNVEME